MTSGPTPASGGPASQRDRHLFAPGPKRVLSLDGGGLRGIVSVAFLARLEALLAERHGRPVLLSDYFDLIGGTSTGAIIAAGLALGMNVAGIRDFYLSLGPKVFRRQYWRAVGIQAKFDAGGLRTELARVFGDRHLDSPDLLTGLAVIMKRIDTGSAWVLANNPRARYWETPADGRHIGNRHFPLANVVRASTAAPHYFDPELIEIVAGTAPGLFVDGSVTPHNNPALQLLLLATLKGYGLEWPLGGEQLLLVSIGTGSFRLELPYGKSRWMPSAGLAVHALKGLIADSQTLTGTLLQWLSGGAAQWPIDSEIGDLAGDTPPFGKPLLSFRRYDARLESAWLSTALGLRVAPLHVARLQRMDDPAVMRELLDIGENAARRFLNPDDLPPAFDVAALRPDRAAG